MSLFRKLAIALFVLSIPIALLSSTIRFLVNEPRVYRYSIDQYDAELTTGIDRDQLLQASADLRRYFNDDEKSIAIQVQQNGRDVSLFNARETAHMKDVKSRFRIVTRAQEFSISYIVVFVAAVVLWARELSVRELAKCALAGCLLTLLTVGVAGAFGAAGFDATWRKLHELIFSNDFWLLSPTSDHLIQMFPPAFWENIVFLAGLLVVAEALLLLLGTAVFLGVTARQDRAPELEPYYAA